MSEWGYNEHICLTLEQRYELLGMCKHGLWQHENCKECAKQKEEVSDFDKGDFRWLKAVADGAMDNLLSVGRAERTLQRIAELEAEVARLRHIIGEYSLSLPRMTARAQAAEAEVENLKAIIRGDGGTKKVNLDKRKEEGK